MPARQPSSTDLQALDVDLAQMLEAQDKSQQPPAPPAPNITDQLAQLQATLLSMSRMGTIERRVDGSFMVPGHEDPRQRQMDTYGSECRCRQCTPHNQRHWVCAICFTMFEWSSGQGPKDEFFVMGDAGIGGLRFCACSNQCALALRAKKAQLVPPMEMAQDRVDVTAIPVSGGDEGYRTLVGQ